MPVVISVENVSKAYRLGMIGGGTLKEDFARWLAKVRGKPDPLLKVGEEHHARLIGEQFWALQNVSFEVKDGEVLGIIGRNGAGKSTLLKILSQVTAPTSGQVKVKGRIASLLEVGTGFHPELTGRENIFLNGAILGMTKAEIRSKLEEIIGFSEMEEFIDTPVKRYSSGMYVRLAFAVAAHLEPEILVVDEVLAVGDTAFQKKCLGKMGNVAKEGRTILFVSHNMAAVQALCQRGILLSEGLIGIDASARDAVRSYVWELTNASVQPLVDRRDRRGDGQLQITDFWIENSIGERVYNAIAGEDVRFCFAYRAARILHSIHVAFNLQEEIGDPIINCNTSDTGQDFKTIPERGIFICEIKKFPLRAHRYIGNLFTTVNGRISDWIQGAFIIDVVDGDFYGTGKLAAQGKVLVSQDWHLCQGI